MDIRIRDIDESGLDVEFIENEAWGEYLPPHGQVTAHLHVDKSEEYIRVTGEATVTLHLECGRCLDPFDYTIVTAVDSTLVPASELGEEDEEELEDKDLDIGTYKGEEFNVDEIVSEHLILALPIKPLCNEECRGLCPVCGVNRNVSNCSCKPEAEVEESPFSVLEKLKFDS